MKNVMGKAFLLLGLLLPAMFVASCAYADKNEVMGEIRLEGRSQVEKTSGVWIDKQYVGYLKELKGSKKVLLLPGEHLITVRQDGYQEFTQRVLVQPGQTEVIPVAMVKAPNVILSATTAEVSCPSTPRGRQSSLTAFTLATSGNFRGYFEECSSRREIIKSASLYPAMRLLKRTSSRSLIKKWKSKRSC